MLNKELKEQYIKDDTTNKTLCNFMPRFFEAIGKYEDEYQKDACNFTIKEIENFFMGLSTSSNLRLQNIKSQFIKYSRYCQDRGLIDDNQIHWLEIDNEFINNVINIGKYRDELVTRDQLLKDINKFPNVSDQFIILAIFEGICGNRYLDFYHLDINQFERNEEDEIILKLKERDVIVSEKLFDLAYESAETYERYPNTFEGKRNMKLMDEPWVIKRAIVATKDTELTHMHQIARRIATIKNDFDLPYCTQAGLTNSGRIDYIMRLNCGEEITVENIKRYYNEVTERYGRIQTYAELINQFLQLYGEEN